MEDSYYLEDYAAITAEGSYSFRVEHQQQRGKLLRAIRPLAAAEELLQEIPLLVWPIAVSVSPPSLVSFCENCMQLQPPTNSNRSNNSNSNNGSSSDGSRFQSPHMLEDNGCLHGERRGDEKEEGVAVLLQPGEPACWFCSSYCRTAALGSATAGVQLSTLQLQQQQQQQQQQLENDTTYPTRLGRKRKASTCAVHSGDDIDADMNTAAEAEAAAAIVENEDCLNGGVSHQQQQQKGQLLGGWLCILRPSLLRRLREKEQFASSSSVAAAATGDTTAAAATGDTVAAAGDTAAGDTTAEAGAVDRKERTAAAKGAVYHQPVRRMIYADPLPTEALARAIARIAAQTHALQTAVGLPLLHAYNVACRPFMRLAQQQQQQHMPTIKQQQLLRELLLLPLQEAVGNEIAEALLSAECLQQLHSTLAINSQTLNVWGAAAATGQLALLRAGGVYTLHACMNHSCEPNCRVSVGPAETPSTQQQPTTRDGNSTTAAAETAAGGGGGGSLLSIETTRAVQAGEELCVSYVDTSLSFEKRQQLLWETYGFKCDCPRCKREGGDFQELLVHQ